MQKYNQITGRNLWKQYIYIRRKNIVSCCWRYWNILYRLETNERRITIMEGEGVDRVITGLSLLGLSACLQCLCLFFLRVLTHSKNGGHISTIRMWLHLSAAAEQCTFILFHVKYQLLETDFEVADTCIVLRFLSTVASTLTNMWIFVISSFYLMLTIKPDKCFTFHSRFLSHCVTWMWTLVSSLMYLVISFLIKEDYRLNYIHTCWDNIPETIHMYLTYGNELIPFVLTAIIISCARCRVPFRQEVLQCFTSHSEYHLDTKHITNTLNCYIILAATLCIYYIGVTFRLLLDDRGSDMTLMIMQSCKGAAIAMMTCFLDHDVMYLVCRRRLAKEYERNGYTTALSSESKQETNNEMGTFKFNWVIMNSVSNKKINIVLVNSSYST